MKKRKKATVLKYDKNYQAPIVTASGIGLIADKIIEKAKECDVPVVENEELADFLTNVDIGESIPEELYEAVAKIIAYVVDTDKLINNSR